MATTIDNNSVARDAIMDRVRKALRKSGDDGKARAHAERYVATHSRGPQPRVGTDLIAQFVERAIHMESTVERIGSRDEIPATVAAYLDALELPAAIAEQKSHTGVCWPEFADLDWSGAGLSIEPRPTQGRDRLGITGCLCAIAETGTLVFIPGPQMPTATTLLPDTHVVVLRASDVVATMEDAFTRVRAAKSRMPRAINFISGPSRTGDIEQTIVLGAHGPYRVHVLLLDPSQIG
jgi:L-lactate dehydrogenase complex protein LldG